MTKDSQKTFGRAMRSEFFLEPEYTPLNHGAFGAWPRALLPVLHKYQMEAESHPDRWLRRWLYPELDSNRQRLAALIHCHPEEMSFIANASHGLCSILRSFPFNKGDKVLCFSTAFNVTERTLTYMKDTHHCLTVTVELAYPLSDQAILDKTRSIIEEEQAKDNGRIRLAVVDAISSTPGVRFPYEAMVRLLREYDIMSFVDGAHTIGHLPLNLHETDPDFFISTCHKWLFTPRSSAILYVPKRNQHLIQPLVINEFYQSPQEAANSVCNFQAAFDWPGAIDFSNFLCINAALDYRASLGGEEAIQAYCTDLAQKGGQRAAEILGTQVMENEDRTLSTCMINVELPLSNVSKSDHEISQTFVDKLMYDYHALVTVYKHNHRWWARFSAQVYNELDEFEDVAKALAKICKELEA
ncbi:pyridoxal phosphate-dependent transferase [Radiomyces spectabilis]|uniref:pyridoxal phosphate-dependent transferase n=1 Tax=Radiomyces spectabilis TaxID=64574 RepID=UPI0022201BE7|nr:pyridoxal phosphate-dependent transferase [Radiomyces spectabilis]KAI8381447.1 pyridoxal phosphate-dependent transferase [Radiomyces spectabilis]